MLVTENKLIMSREIDVIFEDNHLIAVNKRGGDLSQKDNTNDPSLIEKIKSYIKLKYEKPGEVFLGSIHRLDRPTSGAIIYARTSKGLTRMTKLFKEKKIQKSYLALVDKNPPNHTARLSNYLIKDAKKNKSSVTTKDKPGAKFAELTYHVLQNIGKHYLLKIELHTGRHHQIRVQLASMGCRIVGDLKYGYPTPNKDKSICLHCSEISFIHPVTLLPVRITAALPKISEWQKVSLK
jgi:23S rRNA pseudouridine1911/1915/1917 synthase